MFYLPMFMEGLADEGFPYGLHARLAVHDLIDQGRSKMLPVIPLIVPPLRRKLYSSSLYRLRVRISRFRETISLQTSTNPLTVAGVIRGADEIPPIDYAL